MLRKTTTLLLLAVVLVLPSYAQEVWSLERCINHARQNNLTLKQSEIAVSQAELTEKGSRMARLPNVSARTSLGFNYGRGINPVTNDFINTRLGFNNWNLDANATLFNGGAISNTIKQSKLDLEAAKEDANTQFQNISLQMASAYLNILLAEEQVRIAQRAIEQTQEQLAIIDKRIDAGTVPKVDRLDILAQIARNEQTLIQAQNSVEINYLTLKNILELEPDYDLQIVLPDDIMEVNESNAAQTLSSVYAQALNSQATIKASEARMKSAEFGVPIAKADALPRVTLFAGLDTRYASPSNFPSDSYGTQLNNNFGQVVGAQVNFPIYNNHRTRIGIERAKLDIINSEVQNRQVKQQLKADVQAAIANARAAQTELAASERSFEAAQAAFENAQKQYDLGVINTLELTTAKTNLDTAELNVARAKYDYVFRQKIIDFYLGKPMNLK
ncbi:MAG: TolC family protein [Bacteroidota bacterium]